MILQSHDVVFEYDDGTTALDGVSLTVRGGDRLAILGANGAGKSTLLAMLTGLLKPSAGQILLDGQAIRYDRQGLADLRSRVGLVLQDPDDQLFAATVFEDVSFGPLNLGLAESDVRVRVSTALDIMGVPELVDRPTHLLSFGQRKRVAIAGILAMKPSILLLDEPTAGLDPGSIADLMAALSSLSRSGTAVVLATHDMDLAYAWAERVAVFVGGKIVSDGTPDEVFGSDDFSSQSDLRLPTLLRVSKALRRKGMLSDSGPSPRTVEELVQQIET